MAVVVAALLAPAFGARVHDVVSRAAVRARGAARTSTARPRPVPAAAARVQGSSSARHMRDDTQRQSWAAAAASRAAHKAATPTCSRGALALTACPTCGAVLHVARELRARTAPPLAVASSERSCAATASVYAG